MGKKSYTVTAERIVPEYHGIITADSIKEAADLIGTTLSKNGRFHKICLTELLGSPAESYEWTPGYEPLGLKRKTQ